MGNNTTTPRPTTRTDTITTILNRWNELTDPMQARDKTGDGEALPLMPPGYNHPTVQHLEHLLHKLRDQRHHLYWHLNHRYLQNTTRNAWQCPKCGGITQAQHHHHRDSNRKLHRYPGTRVVQTTWHPRVDPRKVTRAIQWLAYNWAIRQEPMLPRVLQDTPTTKRK